MAADALYQAPGRIRHLAVDERGVGLRATWRFERGFVNLSLWRRDMCVEAFHLTPAEASRLIAFLVDGLARAVPEPAPVPGLAVAVAVAVAVAEPVARQPAGSDRLTRCRWLLADGFAAVASRLRR